MTSNSHDNNSHRKISLSCVRKGVALFLPRLGHGGFSLIEILITLTIFSIVMAGVYEAYISQMKNTSREFRMAESDVELGIALNILANDIEMAGYGLAEDYSGTAFNPRAVQATDGDPDTLTLMGTSLGLTSAVSSPSQHWTYIQTVVPGTPPAVTFDGWGDAREDLADNERIILMEPSTKKLLLQGTDWLFRYNGPNALPTTVANSTVTLSEPTVGTLAYGLQGADDPVATQPYYAVRYYLGGESPSHCASGTDSLMRAESRTSETPAGNVTGSSVNPLLACVRDIEVVFDLDTNEDGTSDFRAEGGQHGSIDTARNLRRRLKEVRVYILAQVSDRDPNYTYPSATIWVGDSTLGTGRNVTLTTAQRNYRWRVISLNISPRNIR